MIRINKIEMTEWRILRVANMIERLGHLSKSVANQLREFGAEDPHGFIAKDLDLIAKIRADLKSAGIKI